MSRDVQLRHECPHLTIEERVNLSDDRRSLLIRQPIANSLSVRILINNEFFIPSTGLFSRAQLTGSTSGPFKIVTNETSLVIESSGSTVSFDLPVGTRITTDRVVDLINAEARRGQPSGSLGDILAENENGHLVLSDINAFGSASRIFASGRAATAIGFVNQTGARGQNIFPAWVLEQRTDTITNRFPKFVQPVKSNPIFKVTYSAIPSRCLRCQALIIENDYRFTSQGDVVLVDNESLLLQASLKILLTVKGSNQFHPFYGTEIQSRIGSKAVSSVAAAINEDVSTALENFQALQRAQAQAQEVTFKERLFQIVDVRTVPHVDDPTTFLLDVIVRNASRENIEIPIIFTVPGTVAFSQEGTLSSLALQQLQANPSIPPL